MTYQVMPPLSEADYAALKADIAERGIMVPIEVDEDGAVLDGHHRVKICNELGIHCPRFVREGMDDAGKRTHARRLNIARRHLNSEQKRALIADELRDNAGRNNYQIGTALGVDHKTVANVRTELEGRREIPYVSAFTDTKGRKQPARKPIRYTLIDETPEGVAALKDRVKEVRADEQAISHLIDFQRLKEWFWPLEETWQTFQMPTRNRTRGRLVPISQVHKAVPCRRFTLSEERVAA